MADNNRGRPRDDDRDIYSSSREQRNSQRAPRYRNSETNGPLSELKDNRIVLNEQIVLLSKISGETAEERTGHLLPTKILTAIITSIVIFTVPQKNPRKMAAVMIYLPERKKRKQKKLLLQLYVL